MPDASQAGPMAVLLEHAEHVVGADLAGVDRDHGAEDAGPLGADADAGRPGRAGGCAQRP